MQKYRTVKKSINYLKTSLLARSFYSYLKLADSGCSIHLDQANKYQYLISLVAYLATYLETVKIHLEQEKLTSGGHDPFVKSIHNTY